MSENTVGSGMDRHDGMTIESLMNGNVETTRRFFYEDISHIIHRIQTDLFNGQLEYDEIVNELYLFLAKDNWKKLAGFTGRNNCRLITWMSPVAWRLFVCHYYKLMKCRSADGRFGMRDLSVTGKSVEISLDVNAVMFKMPNRRYAEALDLLVRKGYSAEEVARMWHTNTANIYNIKRRAIKMFTDMYNK